MVFAASGRQIATAMISFFIQMMIERKNWPGFTVCASKWSSAETAPICACRILLRPLSRVFRDYLGAFAVTAGIGEEALAASFEKADDNYSSIMAKALADRFAEAFAEHLHARVPS